MFRNTLELNVYTYIAFPGFKVSQNDCRMWNMSYKYKNISAVQLKFSQKKTQRLHIRLFKNTSTISRRVF
jgi:hypothetical protein